MTGPADRDAAAWSRYWQAGFGDSVYSNGQPVSFEPEWTGFFQTLSADTRLIDLACGAGAVSRLAHAHDAGWDITGVDYADHLPEIEGITTRASVNLAALPFENASFDAAVSQFGFEYCDDPAAVIETARILAPGGRIGLLMHAADGAVVTDTHTILHRADALLAGTGLAATMAAMIRIEAEIPAAELGGNADYLALARQATEAYAKSRDQAVFLGSADAAVDGLQALDALWRKRRDLGTDAALAEIDGIRDTVEDYATRLRALIAAGRSTEQLQALTAQFAEVGVQLEPASAIKRDGRQFGWWVTGAKA